jgi:hypothetical protein
MPKLRIFQAKPLTVLPRHARRPLKHLISNWTTGSYPGVDDVEALMIELTIPKVTPLLLPYRRLKNNSVQSQF